MDALKLITDEDFAAFLRSEAVAAGARAMNHAERALASVKPALRHIGHDGDCVYEINGEVLVSLPRGDDLAWWAHLPAEKCLG